MTDVGTLDGIGGPAAVEVENLHLAFLTLRRRPVYALRGLDLRVPTGSVMGLLGPNGSGKTTTLSCILGLLRPQIGTVRFRGQEIPSQRRQHPRPVHGVLLEDTRLPPFLPVRDALALTARLRGVPRASRRGELDRVIELTGIGSLVGRRVAVLSKGQARRVGLAAALIGDPPLLLLDEPASGLDVSARVEFDETLRRLRDGRRTILLSTHLLGDVESTCTHLAVIRDGRVVAVGETAALLRDPSRDAGDCDIFVRAADLDRVVAAGLAVKRSRYGELSIVESSKSPLEVLRILVDHAIVPARMEPKVTVLGMYLELTRSAESA